MASSNMAVDSAKHSREDHDHDHDHDHEKNDHGTRQNGCHANDNATEDIQPEENSTKHDREDLASDRCTVLVSKAKSTKRPKRVDEKKVKMTQTSDQVHSKQKSSSQQTDEISKSMAGLEISAKKELCEGTGGLERDAREADSLEVQINRLSLEDSWQLLERGPQRNRESHAARQSKPYDKTTAQSPQTLPSADEAFINSVLFDKTVLGHSDDVSAQSQEVVPCNALTTSPSPVNLADDWIDSASNSPDTTVWNIPPVITTSGQYQLSGPGQNSAVDTFHCLPFYDVSQHSAQVPAMSPVPPVSQLGIPVMQPGYVVPPIALNPSTMALAYPSREPQTFVSDQPIYLNSFNVPNTYNCVGQWYYNPSTTSVSYNTPLLTTSTSSGTGCSPQAPGRPTAGCHQPPALTGTMVYSPVDTQNHMKHTDENDNPERDPSIPNIVPTRFDDVSDADKKPKGRRTNRKKSKTKSMTEKKDKKKKDSPKRPSTSTQSPPVLTAEDVTSSLSSIQTSLADSGQINQSMSQDIDAAFKDATEVVTDNLEEDFIAQRLKKGSIQASKSGELDQNIISDINDYQLSPPNSGVGPQPQNACCEACSFNIPVHPLQCDPSLTSTQNSTSQSAVPHVPQCNQMQPMRQSISFNQQLNQLSQKQQNHQDASSETLAHIPFIANLSTHADSNGKFEKPHSAMLLTQTGIDGHSGVPPGQNVPVLQTAPFIQCDQQVQDQQTACIQSTQQVPYQQPSHQQCGQHAAYQQCGQQTANHFMTACEPQYTVPQQQAAPQPVNPGLVSTTCRTHVQVSVTHPTPDRPDHLQMNPVARSPQGIAASTLALGFKMTTPGYSGASPIGGSSTMDIILKQFKPILPKPVHNN